MRLRSERFVVSGGLGFIGRHLVPALIGAGASVAVIDRESRDPRVLGAVARDVHVYREDIRTSDLGRALKDATAAIHLAANPDVRDAEQHPAAVFEENVLGTARLLDAMHAAGVPAIGFASTSTVYGEASPPTPEDYAPLAPVSIYGASKLAGEGLLHGFAKAHGITAIVWRFANVVGGGGTHGVTFDFVRKLRSNPKELEILGQEPGTRKSYIHIDDAIAAMLATWTATERGVETFNVGTEDAITVKEVADEVCRAMGLSGVRYRWSGGVDGGGWRGDIKAMQLAIDRIKTLGWRPRHGSAEAVHLAAKALSLE